MSTALNSSATPAPSRSAAPRPWSVVVAVEMALLRDGITSICETVLGCRVIGHAGDGNAALRLIRSQRPQIAILDLNLPELSTIEIVRHIRAVALPTCAVVLSHRQDRRTVVEALRAGAHAFLLKSGPAGHLTESLNRVMEGAIYVSPLINAESLFNHPRSRREADPLATLSAREHEVFFFLVEGLRPKEIANRLGLSSKTIDTYRAGLMRKLDIHDVAGLVKFAIERKLTGLRQR